MKQSIVIHLKYIYLKHYKKNMVFLKILQLKLVKKIGRLAQL